MLRYAGGALMFALIWASIAYIRGGITDWRELGGAVFVFVVLGTLLCLLVRQVLNIINKVK
jgi:hypothetical protein